MVSVGRAKSDGAAVLETLTLEQRAALEPFAAAWSERWYSTGPVDRARVEHGIAASYRFAGFEPPQRVIWVDSPAVLAVAAPVAASLLDFRQPDRRRSPDRKSIFLALEAALLPSVRRSLHGAVDYRLSNLVLEVRRFRDVGYVLGERVIDPYLWRANKVAAGDAAVTKGHHAVSDALRRALALAVSDGSSPVRERTASVDDAPPRDLRVALTPALRDAIALASSLGLGEPLHRISWRRGDHTEELRAHVNFIEAVRHVIDDDLGDDPDFHAAVRLVIEYDYWNFVLGGRWRMGWGGAYHTFFRDVVQLKLPDDAWARSYAYEEMMSAGWVWPHRDFVMVSEPPVQVHREVEPRPGQDCRDLHNERGPAVLWRDGTALWYLRGINVSQQIVEQPQTLSMMQIVNEPNSELRRILIDRVGAERVLRESRAQMIASDEVGTLWRLNFPQGEPLQMVRVVNSTPEPIGYEPDGGEVGEWRARRWHKHYFLRVPPDVRTARDAVAWSFNLPADDYAPTIES